MSKEFSFKYGDSLVKLTLPENNILNVLHSKEIEPIKDLKKELNNCLDNPISSKPFNEMFLKGDKVTIVISDITRLWIKTVDFLPFIIERLNNQGISDKDIIVLIATGTHRKETPEELAQIVGKEIYNRIEIIEHDCDNSDMAYVGTTSRGTEVYLNKLVTERKVILTGGIVHHLMAGFGGGRKSVVPGVASRKTIQQNHLHTLDPAAPRSNPLTGVGSTVQNPLNLDMIECTEFINPEFLINIVVDTKGNIAKIVAGHWLKAWEKGCQWTDDNFGIEIKELADVVIVSGGGFPKDISLYQSVKALINAALAVKDNGTILFLTECREGAGADAFFGWSKHLKEGNLDPALRENFTIPGYVFYATVEIAQAKRTILYSTIEPELLEPMGIIPAASLDEALNLAQLEDKKIIVMPYAANTVPIYIP